MAALLMDVVFREYESKHLTLFDTHREDIFVDIMEH